jgi:TP901 family phage tail tape measure protein
MPTNPKDLVLGVLFKAKPDPNFSKITRRLSSILTQFSKGMDKVDKAGKRLDGTMKKLKTATGAVSKGMKQTGDVTEGTGKQIGKITKGLDRLVAAFKVVAVYTVAGRMFQGFQQAVASGVREIIEFDQALANLKAITGATDAEIANMRDTLKETALRTKFSTTEIAEGMVLLGQAGLSGAESMQAIDAVADLAAGTLSDFRNVSDLVTTTLRAFNLEAGETRRVADVMANAVNKSKLSIDKLRTAFNYVGAGAAQAGLSLEVTAASMMVLANNGLRASTIGTGLRQVLARLLAPNAKLQEAMSRYGLSLDKATGQAGWFEKQIGKLASVMYDFEKGTVDMSKAYSLFGLRGAQAAAILTNAFMGLDGTWEIMLDKVRQVGTANEMMLRQSEGLGFKIKNLADSFGVLAVNLGEAGLTGAIRGTVDALRDLVKLMGSGVQLSVGRAITTFLGLAGALYTVQLAIKAIKLGLTGKEGKALIALRAFFFGPWGWAILAMSTAAGVLTYFVSQARRAREELGRQATAAQKVTNSIETYKDQLEKVKEGTTEYTVLVERLKQELPDYADKIDEVSGSYKLLLEFLDKLNKTQQELSVAATGKVFLIDLKKTLDSAIAPLGGDVLADSIVDLMDKGLKKANPQVEKLLSEFSQFIYGTYVKEMNLGKSRHQVQNAIVDLFMPEGAYSEIYVKYPKHVKDILRRIDKMFDEFEARRKRQLEARIQAEKELVESLPKVYQDYLKALWNADEISKYVRFLKAAADARAKVVKVVKEFEALNEKNFKNEKDRQDKIAKLTKQIFDDELESFTKKELKKGKIGETALDRIRKKMAKIEAETKGAYEKEYLILKDKYTRIEGEIEKHVKNNEEKKKMLLNIWIDYYAKLQRLADKYGVPPHMLKEVLDSLNKMGAVAGVPEVPVPRKQPTEEGGSFRGETPEQRAARLEKEGKTEYKLGKQGRIDDATKIEENYRRGKASAEDYYKAVDALRTEGVYSEREAAKKKRTEAQGLWANLKEGWNDYFEDMQTTGEWVQEFAGEFVEQLSDSFADAWGDFLDGTKSAKEAFKDFARDMLRWLAQIAMKKAMLQALSFIGMHSGGMYGEQTGAPRRLKGPMFVPKLHNGLMNDEFAAILKKDEGVFTKKQMAALGGMIKGTQINVPVNVAGENGDRLKRHLPGEIEQTVLKVMRRYM